MEHASVFEAGMPDWQDLRLFLELDRRGSFRAASAVVGLSINTLRRRIDDLEAQLGVTLLTRHAAGIRLTTEGEAILAAARTMERAAYQSCAPGMPLRRRRPARCGSPSPRASARSGWRRASSSFSARIPGSWWICAARWNPADVCGLEADVAMQLVRPSSPDLRWSSSAACTPCRSPRAATEIYGVPAKPEDARAAPDRAPGREPDRRHGGDDRQTPEDAATEIT